jgi:Flp pilus assembly protein TadG
MDEIRISPCDRRSCLERLTLVLRLASRDDAGQEIVEAAFVLPILFLIMLAIFWFARAFNISSTLDRAAMEGIKAASRRSCATCGNAFQTDSQVVAQITAVLNADRLQIGSVQTYSPAYACTATPAPSCTTTVQNVRICRGVPLTCGDVACQTPTPAACGANPKLGVRISFAYQTPTPLNIANLPPIVIHASAQSGAEN